jgi:CDP-diacylglycerol--serine O-phosphatidyltransferase
VKIKSNIPNGFTLLNLLSGVIGIIWVLQGDILSGAYFILISTVFDFFDGFAARILKVPSEIGKQLDSLADLVSFGVLPGFILFKMAEVQSGWEWLPYFTLIVPLLSATPANALFISTLPYLGISVPQVGVWLNNPLILVIVAWVMAILLVLEIPLIALKFKNFLLKSNVFRYTLLGMAALLISFLGLAGIPWVILAYISLSLIENGIKRQ